MKLKRILLILFCFISIIEVKSCPDSLSNRKKNLESIAQEYLAHCNVDYSKDRILDSKFLLSVFTYKTDTIIFVTMVHKKYYPIYNPMGEISTNPILEAKSDNDQFTICIDKTISAEYIQDLFNAEVLDIDSLCQVEVPLMRYEAPEYTFKIRNEITVEFVQDQFLPIPLSKACMPNNWYEPKEDEFESLIIEE